MNKYKVAVFDLDGTLFNTKRGIVKAIKKTIETEGLKMLRDDEFDQFIGPPIQNTFARVYGLTQEEGANIANTFRNFYHLDEYILEADEYPGMRDTLNKLTQNGYCLALATFKREEMAHNICRHFGYDRFIGSIHGSDIKNKRTKQDIIEICLNDYDCCGGCDAVMIGDSEFDAKGAEAAGVDFIGVTYGFGFRSKEDIYRFPGSVAAGSPEELFDVLSGGNR